MVYASSAPRHRAEHDANEANAINEPVVRLEVQRDTTPRQTFEYVQLPEWLASVQASHVDIADPIEQGLFVAVARQPVPEHLCGRVDIRILDERWQPGKALRVTSLQLNGGPTGHRSMRCTRRSANCALPLRGGASTISEPIFIGRCSVSSMKKAWSIGDMRVMREC